jgi:hypothetical protein
MGRRFSVTFDDTRAERIERMAQRLKTQPDSLLLHFLLEKLTELENPTGYATRSKEISKYDYTCR